MSQGVHRNETVSEMLRNIRSEGKAPKSSGMTIKKGFAVTAATVLGVLGTVFAVSSIGNPSGDAGSANKPPVHDTDSFDLTNE